MSWKGTILFIRPPGTEHYIVPHSLHDLTGEEAGRAEYGSGFDPTD
jgi:hypothetical protein